MRQLFGSCGSAARLDVLVATYLDMSSEGKNKDASWLARRTGKWMSMQNAAREEEGEGKKRKQR